MKLRLRASSTAEDVAYLVGFVALLVGLLLGVWWLGWQLWMFVVGAFFPGAPDHVARPGYWAFAAAWVLLVLIGTAIFGRRGRKE